MYFFNPVNEWLNEGVYWAGGCRKGKHDLPINESLNNSQ